jgi:ferrous iron transport protein A
MFTPFTVTGSSLELLQPGDSGIIIACQSQDETIRKKLIAMGIRTGFNITVEQTFPSLMVKVANVSITINRDIARVIYVRLLI